MQQQLMSPPQTSELSAQQPVARHIPSGGYRCLSRPTRLLAWFDAEVPELFVVKGLSPHGIWLQAQHYRASSLGSAGGNGRLWLDYGGVRLGPLAVELCSAMPPDWLQAADENAVGVAIPLGPLSELRELAGYIKVLEQKGVLLAPDRDPVAAERVSDPHQVRELLEFLARERVTGSVSTSSGRRDVQIADVPATALHWRDPLTDWQLPATVDFTYLNTVFQVPVSSRREERSVAMPTWIGKLARRRTRRADAPANLSIHFCHPVSGELRVAANVLDLSRTGLSFAASALDNLLYPALLLPHFELRLAGRPAGHYRGCIRNCREQEAQDGVVGVSFEPLSAADAAQLGQLVDPVLYPSTQGRASDVWGVFESSGYLHLSDKQPADFEWLREPFLRVAHALAGAPEVGTVAHWPANGPIQATVSHLKMYCSSWLLCQVSKLKGQGASADGRAGLREMYLRIYESAHLDPDTRWLLVYVQDEAPRWSRELHVELPRRYVHTGEACLIPFRALEGDVMPNPLRAVGSDLTVSTATASVARDAMRDLSRVRPAQYLDALDLSAERFDLAPVRARWNGAGLERERQLLVAYEGGVRTALAVVEVAELGSHLYGLLDCLRMYPLRPGGERAFGALLREAHRWFQQRGRRQFTYLEEYPNSLPLRELGFRDMGGATFTMLSIDRMPELMQRTSELASQRPPPMVSQLQS